MPSVLFTNMLMLAGLTALAIPVIIHLLLKSRRKRMKFSTVQFFLKQDEQSARKRKIRHWLLLALRMLIFMLLVLAFARPFLPESESAVATQPRRQVVFVLDRSASMQAVGSDGPRWTLAKQRLQKALSELQPEDRVALIGCSTHTEILSGFATPSVVAKLAGELSPTFGTSDLGEGLGQAVRLLARNDPTLVCSIAVISDLQKNACQRLASFPVPDEVEVKVLEVGDRLAPNLAVSQLQVETRTGEKPNLTAASFSDEDHPSLGIDINIDGKAAYSRSVNLVSGAVTNLELALPALKPGWHNLQASLRSKDAQKWDDVRHSALFIPEPTRVMVVESRSTKRLFEEESFFVATALDPTQGSTNAVQSPYNVAKIRPEELIDRVSVNPNVPPPDLVVLPGLRQIPSGAGSALSAFVRAGGGILFFVNEELSANRYNSEFQGLLPVRLGNLDTVVEWGSGWRIGEFDTNTMVFAPFGRPNSGDLRIPEFIRRYLVTPVEGAAQPAIFDDGMGLLVTRSFGKGRVALVNSTADTAWNDWPKHRTFVPFLHGLAKQLALKSDVGFVQETNSFVAGEDFEIALGKGAAKLRFQVLAPDGEEMSVTADDQGRLSSADAPMPGIYTLKNPSGQEARRFAVNLSPRESDLAALSPIEFQQQLARVKVASDVTFSAGLFGPTRDRKELWRVLLLAVLALLFVEVLAANRTVA